MMRKKHLTYQKQSDSDIINVGFLKIWTNKFMRKIDPYSGVHTTDDVEVPI